MGDREKVITHLDDMRLLADIKIHPIVSPENWNVYSDLCDLIDVVKKDVLDLLKEQEPVEPRIQTSSSGVTWWNVCGNCQTAINPNDKYCHECGRPVKWK